MLLSAVARHGAMEAAEAGARTQPLVAAKRVPVRNTMQVEGGVAAVR